MKVIKPPFLAVDVETMAQIDVRLTSERNLVDSYEQPVPNEHQ